MPRNEPTPEKEALIQAYVEGHLTPEEGVRLRDLVRDDPALARVIVENVQMDGAIREVVGERALDAEPVRRPSPRWRSTRRSTRPGMGPFLGILAAACFLLVVGLAIHVSRKPPPRPPSPSVPSEARVPREETPRPPEPKPAPPEERPKPPVEKPVSPPKPPVPEPEAPRPEPPKPEPPKPEPPKPEPPKAAPIETRSAVARVEGDAQIDDRKIAGPHDLLAGQRLETAAGRAQVGFPDRTRVELGPQTLLREVKVDGGKTVLLDRGEIRAVVSAQPKDRPMVFLTPHGKATVKGTTLRILVDAKATRLEVTEGKVELEGLAGKAVMVENGHYAVAAAGAAPAAKADARLCLESDGGVVINFGPDSTAGLALPDRWLGYRVLNDAGAEFDPARGYGWKEPNPPPGGSLGKSHLPGFWDQSNKLQTDPMHATFVYGGSATETVEWRVALPNGRYQVAVSVGTYMFDQGPHHVKLQGLQVIDRVMTKKGVFVPGQAVIDVTNGELTMVLGGHGAPKPSDDTVVNYILIKRAKK